MMNLTLDGWIDGITATMAVLCGVVLGIFFILKGRKIKAKALIILGFTSMFAGLLYFGVLFDFIWVLITTVNFDNSAGQVGLLSYIWFVPTIVCAMAFGLQLEEADKPIYILSIYIIFGILFEIVVFMNPIGSFEFTTYTDGTLLTDYNINMMSLAGFIMLGMLALVIAFMGVGALLKARQSTGAIKRRFLLSSLGIFCFGIFGVLEGLTIAVGGFLIFVRIGYISSFILMYISLS